MKKRKDDIVDFTSESDAAMTEAWKKETEAAFAKEVAAFERMKAELIEKYQGHYVVIYQERVVAHGSDKATLIKQFYKQYGEHPCYIERAAWDTPRKVRITSVWRVRK